MHRPAGPLARRAGTGAVQRLLAKRRIFIALPYQLRLEDEGGSGSGSVHADRHARPKSNQSPIRSTLSSTYFNASRGEVAAGPSKRPMAAVEQFRRAIEGGDVAGLHSTYDQVRKEAIRNQKAQHRPATPQSEGIPPLMVEDMRAAMRLALGVPASHVPRSYQAEKRWKRGDVQGRGISSAEEGRLVQQMFHDSVNLFAFTIATPDCRCLLSSLALQKKSPSFTFDQFLHLTSTFPDYSVSWRDGMVVIGLCVSNGNDAETAQKMWDYLLQRQVKIDMDLRDLFLSLLLKAGDVEQAIGIANSKREDLQLFPLENQKTTSVAWFLEGLCRAGQGLQSHTANVAENLHSRLREGRASGTAVVWHALAIHACLVEDGNAALQMVRYALEISRFQPDASTFNILLLCHGKELHRMARGGTEGEVVQLLERIQAACGVAPDKVSYSIGISALLGSVPSLLYNGKRTKARHRKALPSQSALDGGRSPTTLENNMSREKAKLALVLNGVGRLESAERDGDREGEGEVGPLHIPRHTPGQIHEATLLYERYRSMRMPIDNIMVHPLIDAYTNTYVPSLARAVELYNDVRSSFATHRQKEAVQAGEEARVSEEVYDVMLYACAKARDLTLAGRLIQDMIDDGISLSPSNMSNLTVLLMQASNSYQAAHQAYTGLRDASIAVMGEDGQGGGVVSGGRVPFGRHGWLRIIDCFSKLQFDPQTLPPVEVMLEMVGDMNEHGFPTEAITYTTFLRYYGRKAMLFTNKDAVRSAVLALHSYLQNHDTVEPDLTLVTALIDAYSRVRLPEQALEVWNRLVLNRNRVDSACIAVVLDTCGRSGRLAEARRAWDWVRGRGPEQKSQCNKGAWDAWIECLARTGRLTEAIEDAFGEMRAELQARGEPEPDAKTMEMLLRFASANKQRWTHGSDVEFATLAQLKERLQREMPSVWDQVKVIAIPLE